MSRLLKKIIPVHFATGRIEQLLSLMNLNFLSSNQYFFKQGFHVISNQILRKMALKYG